MRPSGMREAEPGLKTMPERKYLLTITVKYTGEFFYDMIVVMLILIKAKTVVDFANV